ncbi:Uncharacterised nucleotidyltransferase [Desulfacinum hydrothermale DSM 13146]|uniref:Uncharacterized nucleotidyltransferase n=1 Tax=Desulfacinum hydrothermale DSM 13146 TaxID=1121390 RepID=A0A1W1XAU2_9BACT|nr:nucleotidyltransferase family protein [Desulfacinum hydrothermale]SMC20979.1 Uncharacterised nucleotidyltransferase [Desulfacinum hydrothermale DSM 13146]
MDCHGDSLLMAVETLLAGLASPAVFRSLEEEDWDRLVRVARRNNLLGRVACVAQDAGITDRLPVRIRRHLEAAARLADAHRRALLWELDRIRWALRDMDGPVVLLKGAAYAAEGLEVARGRLSADVDILVRRRDLPAVERALLDKGWEPVKESDYDQAYYRKWMHELPPLRHKDRGSVVDVHHNILPLTGRIRIDSRLFFQAARKSRLDGYLVLGGEDMVLHNVVHLFQDGVVTGSLRDVVDLDALIAHWGRRASFWDDLLARASQLGVERPLAYALWVAPRIMGTPVPGGVVEELERKAIRWQVIRRIMVGAMERALTAGDLCGMGPLAALSQWFLYLRSHWLRMPPLLLARHALFKSARSLRSS